VTDLAIGVDVGGTKIAAGVVDREGRILKRVERPTPSGSQDAFLATVDEVVVSLREDGVGAVGFGMPSTIDQRTGRIVNSVHVPIGDFDFRGHMADLMAWGVSLCEIKCHSQQLGAEWADPGCAP